MPRRSAIGEGTIYRRKDGRWEAAAYFLTIDGKRKRFRLYAKTREEAHDKLVETKQQAKRGNPLPDRSWKLGDYLDYWLAKEWRRPLTCRRHESVVRLHIRPRLGHCRLNHLSVQIVQNFIDSLAADGVSVASIHQIRKVLSAALTYAVRQELLSRNVARLVELPEYRPAEARHWRLDETVRFLEAARSDPLYPAFLLLSLYGLRRGEVLGIRWKDVDLEQNVLRIRQQVQRIDGRLQQVALKTNTSRRDEPLLPTAREVLLKQHEVQAGMRKAAGGDWQGTGGEDELVFTTRTGRPAESHNLNRSFLRICQQQGLRRITVHGLRHSNATAQKNLQIHARDIQAILGHGDVRTTGIYEHVDMDSKRKALGRMERALFANNGEDVRSRQERQGSDRVYCRQLLPSDGGLLSSKHRIIFGGSSQTRTGDTRLFSSVSGLKPDPVSEVMLALHDRTTHWLLGRVAVKHSRQILFFEPTRSPMEVWSFAKRWLGGPDHGW